MTAKALDFDSTTLWYDLWILILL